MNLRSMCVVVGVLGATMALAFGLLQVAEGRGKAASADGRHANFQFNVRKFTKGTLVRKEGTLLIEIVDRNTVDGVRIHMRELRDLDVDGKVARFEGPGRIRFQTKAGVVEKRGHVFAVVRDNRRPAGPIEPRDTIMVRFEAAEGPLTYRFEGVVRDGDIAVGRREVQ